MRDRYFNFLCDFVGNRAHEFNRLLSELHAMEFYTLIPNDDNRAEDGKELRTRFMDKEGLQHALSFSFLEPFDPCSVLEMLIGLSLRLEFETMSSRWEKTPEEWFWILIDNLGLSWCNDSIFDKEEVVMKIQTFLDRHYKHDGNGGLFPLKNPRKDQRRIEIWYQMSAYILENYPI